MDKSVRLPAFLFEKSLSLYILFVLKARAYSSSVERAHGMGEGGVQFPVGPSEQSECGTKKTTCVVFVGN